MTYERPGQPFNPNAEFDSIEGHRSGAHARQPAGTKSELVGSMSKPVSERKLRQTIKRAEKKRDAVPPPAPEEKPEPELKIDLGCGPHPREGYEGCDQYDFKNDKGESVVKHIFNIGVDAWPFADGSVTEAWSSHTVEHLTAVQRCHFMNELQRVLVKGGKAILTVPHWGSCRAYGDPTHQWPPMGEFWFYYLDRTWRMANAPHTDKQHWPQGYDCDFSSGWGYSLNPYFEAKAQEPKQFAANHYREAIMDMQATVTKK